MFTSCTDCRRTYDDAEQSTICPHEALPEPRPTIPVVSGPELAVSSIDVKFTFGELLGMEAALGMAVENLKNVGVSDEAFCLAEEGLEKIRAARHRYIKPENLEDIEKTMQRFRRKEKA